MLLNLTIAGALLSYRENKPNPSVKRDGAKVRRPLPSR